MFNQYRGWMMQPEGPRPNRRERDYWFNRTKPQPPLSPEEIIAKRERRLEMLARKEGNEPTSFRKTTKLGNDGKGGAVVYLGPWQKQDNTRSRKVMRSHTRLA